MSQGEGQRPVVQNVVAVDGVAYGVIGADLHVFGHGGVPLYLLANWRRMPHADRGWLRELPSRMLNARFAVVDFTGRATEVEQLRRWRDGGRRLELRWLYGPAGQGKTRLADQLAQDSARAGWKIITATHGPGTVVEPQGRQDLRLGDAVGRLVIVDYADRWPLTHLTWLLSNSLFHDAAPARVLFLARTADAWPAVSAALTNLQPGTTSQFLDPLPEQASQREVMFGAARTAFARHYELTDSSNIHPPGPLEDAEMGLTLAVHMAALVAVDAHATGEHHPPADMAGLTIYLLNREHLHWARLYDDGAVSGLRLDRSDRRFFTPPQIMNQVVYTSALTGPVSRPTGTRALGLLATGQAAEQLLADHAACYPPTDHATVLEPLYPDRLAEDFLALTMPGHPADYPAQPWAPATTSTLLTRGDDRAPTPYTPRAMTFLATAAQRWPHLGERYLHPVLRRDPQLAIDAGSAALTALATTETADLAVLEAIESRFPSHRHVNLDIGIAAVATRLAPQAGFRPPPGRTRPHPLNLGVPTGQRRPARPRPDRKRRRRPHFA